MKKNMRTWLAVFAVVVVAAPASAATVCGVVHNTQGQPAGGVQIVVKDTSGKAIGQATTDKDGNYLIDGVGKGKLDLFLNPATTGYKAGSGVLTETSASSSMVNWQISDATPALAAQTGTCDDPPAAFWPWPEEISIAVLGVAGLGALGSGLYLGFTENGDQQQHVKLPVSPSS